MASIIFAIAGIIFTICGYFYADNWEKKNKKHQQMSLKFEQIPQEEITEKKITEYIVDKMLYSMPSEYDIKYVQTVSTVEFDNPESILETWLSNGILFGPKLIEPVLEHFKNLRDDDMPENYIEDVINEFWERFNMKLFVIQNKRFKLIKKYDNVAKEFSKELSIRNESYAVVEHVLINLGYKENEITTALREAMNLVSDLNDAQQILTKALCILIAM